MKTFKKTDEEYIDTHKAQEQLLSRFNPVPVLILISVFYMNYQRFYDILKDSLYLLYGSIVVLDYPNTLALSSVSPSPSSVIITVLLTTYTTFGD